MTHFLSRRGKLNFPNIFWNHEKNNEKIDIRETIYRLRFGGTFDTTSDKYDDESKASNSNATSFCDHWPSLRNSMTRKCNIPFWLQKWYDEKSDEQLGTEVSS